MLQRVPEHRNKMPFSIGDRLYFSTAEVINDTAISRQTLWRWRQGGKVPAGHRFRDRQVLFDEEQFEAIRNYANHIERLDAAALTFSTRRGPEA